MASAPFIVEALFNFKGTNNDELCFKKGDKITITQKDDEGWWEGTLGDKTGWFPSNYVKECKDVAISQPMSPAAQRQNRAVVLKDLIDSEKAHVTELQSLLKNFLKPLEKSTILTTDEYKQLTGNINDVVDAHQQLLNLVEECETKPSDEQRVGKLFLTWAPRIKAIHQAYCSMHPKAVCILDLHKDELATYMESCGAATPGLLVLTTGLSKPFRRLDKYSQMLQELERHVEVNHPDRGDIQRSVAVYKDIASTCLATRRQKELELQVLTGPVRGWEGQSLAQLGDIIHMGLVTVEPQHQDRYLVLFPNTLLMLSISHRMSAFIYEGKLPLTNISVNRLEDTESQKNVFEISGPLIEKIVAVCQTKEETIHWVELLRQHTNKGHMRTPPLPSIDGHRSTPHMSPLSPTAISGHRSVPLPSQVNRSPSSLAHQSVLNNNLGWSAICLRPSPPVRLLAVGNNNTPHGSPLSRSNNYINNKLPLHDEDSKILQVIEAYCSSAKPKNHNTVNSGITPKTSMVPEKSLTENVRVLQDEVKELKCIASVLFKQLTEEQIARSTLQNIIKNYLVSSSKDAEKIHWPKVT